MVARNLYTYNLHNLYLGVRETQPRKISKNYINKNKKNIN